VASVAPPTLETFVSTKGEITASTIARIAGNLLSNRYPIGQGDVEIAVHAARAIAAEVQRTTPKEGK